MFVPRIFVDDALTLNQHLTLNKEKTHYLQVIRANVNDTIIVFNGQGGAYQSTLTVLKKEAVVVLNAFIPPSPQHTTFELGQALLRGDKMDFVIQKATELGVTHIVPLIAHHGVMKLHKDREQKRISHWRNIIISACEQCGRNDLPQLAPPMSVQDWASASFQGASLVFDPTGISCRELQPEKSFRMALGPESGWVSTELSFFQSKQFQMCRLGPRVLRAETAPLVALSCLQTRFGDF